MNPHHPDVNLIMVACWTSGAAIRLMADMLRHMPGFVQNHVASDIANGSGMVGVYLAAMGILGQVVNGIINDRKGVREMKLQNLNLQGQVNQAKADALEIAGRLEARLSKSEERADESEQQADKLKAELAETRKNNHARDNLYNAQVVTLKAEKLDLSDQVKENAARIADLMAQLDRLQQRHGGAINAHSEEIGEIADKLEMPMNPPRVNGDEGSET